MSSPATKAPTTKKNTPSTTANAKPSDVKVDKPQGTINKAPGGGSSVAPPTKTHPPPPREMNGNPPPPGGPGLGQDQNAMAGGPPMMYGGTGMPTNPMMMMPNQQQFGYPPNPAAAMGYGSMYGPPMGMGYGNGSMYGYNSMYGMPGPNMMGGGAPPPMMTGQGSMYGSMYGMQPMMGSMYGSTYGSMYGPHSMLGGGVSLYGGHSFGRAGSLYGLGGSLYGGSDANSVMGSMYGMGSMYHALMPHTSLGTVVKSDRPFSITFGGTSLSETKSHYNSIAAGEPTLSRRESMKGMSIDPTVSGTTRDLASSPTKSSSPRRTGARVVTLVEEAPKSPTSASPTDNSLRILTIIEESGSSKVFLKVNAKQPTTSVVCVDSKQSFDVDEVIVVGKKAATNQIKSKVMKDQIVDQLCSGHNAALLVAHDEEAIHSSRHAIQAAVALLRETLEANQKTGGKKYCLDLTLGVVEGANVQDQFKPESGYTAFQSGNTPLLGTAITSLVSKTITSQKMFDDAFIAACGNTVRGENPRTLLGSITVAQQVQGGGGDTFLSRFLFSVCNNVEVYTNAITNLDQGEFADVLRYAFGGTCSTVLAVCFTDSIEAPEVALRQVRKITAVADTFYLIPRSGNVRRFIEHTELVAKKLAAIGTPENTRNAERLRSIASDYKKILADPFNNKPRVYDTNGGETPSSQQDDKAAPQQRAAPAMMASPARQAASPSTGGRPPNKAAPDAGSNPIQKILIRGGGESAAYQLDDLVVTPKRSGVSFNLHEAIEITRVTPADMHSPAVEGIVKFFTEGYNACILAIDSDKIAKGPFASPSWGAVRSAARAALEKKAPASHLRASISVVKSSGETADLLDSSAAVHPLVVASSPLFGPIVDNSALQDVPSSEAFEKLIQSAKARLAANETTLWGHDAAVYVTLVYSFAEGDDCNVSSFMASFAGPNVEVLQNAVDRKGALRELHRYALGGTSATVFAVSLHKDDYATFATNALGILQAAGALTKRTHRKGSVKTFVNYTNASIANRRDVLKKTTDPKERRTCEQMLGPMEKMLADHMGVLSDPDKNLPDAYAPGSNALFTASSSRIQRNSSQDVAKAALENTQSEQSLPSKSRDAVKMVSDKGLVVVVDRVVDDATESKQRTFEGKEYQLVGVVQNDEQSLFDSVISRELTTVYADQCRNAAVFSASDMTSALEKEPVWHVLEKLVTQSALVAQASPSANADYRVEISIAIISDTEVIADLLIPGGDVRAPVQVTKSPIWGGRVTTTAVTVRTAEKAQQCIRGARDACSAAHSAAIKEGDAMLVCTAVQRRHSADDVHLGSLLVTLCGPSARAYHEAAASALCPRAKLLSIALSSGYHTVGLLNFGDVSEAAAAAMASGVSTLLSGKRAASGRSSAISDFLKTTEAALKHMTAHPGPDPEFAESKRSSVAKSVADHKALIGNVDAPIPEHWSSPAEQQPQSADAEQPQAAAAGSSPATVPDNSERLPVSTVAVITKSRKTSGDIAVTQDGDSTIVLTKSGSGGKTESFAFTEVTSRADSSSSVRSREISIMTDMVIAGRNGALILSEDTAGAGDTTASLSAALPLKVARSVIGGINNKLEAYWTVVALKEDRYRDLLASSSPSGSSSSSYEPITVASSPLYGPTVAAANLELVVNPSAMDSTYHAAHAAAAADQAMLMVTLVLKQIMEDDVMLHSLVLLVDTTGGSGLVKLMSTVTQQEPHARGLMAYILGGSCKTVTVMGLSSLTEGPMVSESMKAFMMASEIKNVRLRDGSVKQFLEFSEIAGKKLEKNIADAQDAENTERWRRLLAAHNKRVEDSQALLKSPVSLVPPRFLD